MKKLWIVTLALCLVAGAAHAQLFTFGPKVGLSTTNMNLRGEYENLAQGEGSYGFHAGLFTRLKIAAIYVQPEFLFTSASGQMIDQSDAVNNPQGTLVGYRFSRLDVPIMVGGKFSIFRVYAGPLASVLISASEVKDAATSRDVSGLLRDVSLGYQAGIGLDLGPIIADLKYEGGFPVQLDYTTELGNTVSLDARTNQVILSVGYKIIK